MLLRFPPTDEVTATFGSVAILVAGTTCGSVGLSSRSEGEWELVATGQFEACRRDSATVSLATFGGQPLAQALLFAPGETVRMTDFAPRFPIIAPPRTPLLDATRAEIIFTARGGSDRSASELLSGRVVVFAGGELCAELAFVTAPATISIGDAGQPATCHRDGAILNLVDGRGALLFVAPFLQLG
ncbi:MAG: hypothetical protein O2895_04230 [Chloroflexi bacterium]|nr:hypothetical protein [Chloroflexota bacterium]